MATSAFTKFVLGAAAIGLGTLMTVGAPSAHASEKSDCEGKGGTYTETSFTWNGKPSTVYRCCVKDTATNTTSCTSTTVTKNLQPVEPVAPAQRVPLDVVNTNTPIQLAP